MAYWIWWGLLPFYQIFSTLFSWVVSIRTIYFTNQRYFGAMKMHMKVVISIYCSLWNWFLNMVIGKAVLYWIELVPAHHLCSLTHLLTVFFSWWQSRMLLQPELVLEDVSQDHARKTVLRFFMLFTNRYCTRTQIVPFCFGSAISRPRNCYLAESWCGWIKFLWCCAHACILVWVPAWLYSTNRSPWLTNGVMWLWP
jgi:hypothetical protein